MHIPGQESNYLIVTYLSQFQALMKLQNLKAQSGSETDPMNSVSS